MDKRAILITGCSSGIGYCVAKGLLDRGYRVFATARRMEDVEVLVSQGMESLLLDLRDCSSIRSAINEILSRTGGTLYGLFNNGGYGQPGAIEDLDTNVLREQFETNFFGWHELTRSILPVMRKQGYGRIIQNSSVLGFVALPLRGAYIASKHALEGLSNTLRMELRNTNIFVSILEPGPISSEFRNNSFKKLKENINFDQSHFSDYYFSMEKRLTKKLAPLPFTLSGEAVLKKIVHALESPNPNSHYHITFPTHLFSFLKRVLPFKLLDIVLSMASDRG